MDGYALSQAFLLFLHILLPIGGAVLAGGILAGVLQAVTRVEDRSIGFAGRLGGFVLGTYIAAKTSGALLVEYAVRLWSGSGYY